MANELSLPILDKHQLAKLEAIYKPRCLGLSEDIGLHREYAGMVKLVQALRAASDLRLASTEDGGDEDHFDTSEGERAHS